MRTPSVSRRAILVTSSPNVGAYVSSLFIKFGEYFVVMNAPPVGEPVYTHNRLVRSINVIANVRPEFVILGPMSPHERDTLETSLELYFPVNGRELGDTREVFRESAVAHPISP